MLQYRHDPDPLQSLQNLLRLKKKKNHVVCPQPKAVFQGGFIVWVWFTVWSVGDRLHIMRVTSSRCTSDELQWREVEHPNLI